jgi:hypothetical protein
VPGEYARACSANPPDPHAERRSLLFRERLIFTFFPRNREWPCATPARRQQILQLLIEHGSVQVADLVERFGVSADHPCRPDPLGIAGPGQPHPRWRHRVHAPPQEQDIHEKDALNLPLKESIGA